MEKLFGSVHASVGSTSSDLILKTRGKVKILIGKRFIDLLDETGNIKTNNKSIINEVDSLDDISSQGIYLIDNLVYIKFSDSLIQISGLDNEVKENKFEFNTLEDAILTIDDGIAFVKDKIYYISGMEAKLLNPTYDISLTTTEVEIPEVFDSLRSTNYEFELNTENGISTLEVDNITERNISNKIVSSTIVCLIKDLYTLDSILLNGIFVETNHKIIPEADCTVTELSDNFYKIQYSLIYLNLMYVGMKLKFDIYKYITNPSCELYLDLNKTLLLNKYLIYNYGKYLKGNINIQFTNSTVYETVLGNQSTTHIFQNYTLNYIDDTINVDWYVNGVKINGNSFDITEEGTYLVEAVIEETELYNKSTGGYTIECSRSNTNIT